MNLQPGHYITGIEPIGCFNSGVAPTIARSRKAKRYIGKEYIVGKDIEVTLNLTENILAVMKGKQPKVKFFATKAPAIKLFEKMNRDMDQYNRDEIKQTKELRNKANAGDIEALLSLADRGL